MLDTPQAVDLDIARELARIGSITQTPSVGAPNPSPEEDRVRSNISKTVESISEIVGERRRQLLADGEALKAAIDSLNSDFAVACEALINQLTKRAAELRGQHEDFTRLALAAQESVRRTVEE